MVSIELLSVSQQGLPSSDDEEQVLAAPFPEGESGVSDHLFTPEWSLAWLVSGKNVRPALKAARIELALDVVDVSAGRGEGARGSGNVGEQIVSRRGRGMVPLARRMSTLVRLPPPYRRPRLSGRRRQGLGLRLAGDHPGESCGECSSPPAGRINESHRSPPPAGSIERIRACRWVGAADCRRPRRWSTGPSQCRAWRHRGSPSHPRHRHLPNTGSPRSPWRPHLHRRQLRNPQQRLGR